MATESPLIRDGAQCVAAADLSDAQFKAVKLTGARSLNLASTGGEGIYGILQNKPQEGEVTDAGIFGITKALAGAAFDAGALLQTDNTARLITKTSTNVVVAIALEAATAAGQIATVKLVPVAG